jgi:PD-(D/E)XK nuclease superfamily
MATKTTRAHQRYTLSDGTPAPGVTTVLGILAKPALIYWAWDLGMKGEDYRKVRDKAADIGTIAHALIEADIKGVTLDKSDYAPSSLDKAETAYLAWLDWKKNFELETVASEVQLASEKFGYGGTLDWIARRDGHIWLVDFKSSKGIYDEMRYQLAAYQVLWNENNPDKPIAHCHIVKIGKEDGAFEHHKFEDLTKEFEIFRHCLAIYKLTKKK